MGVYIHTNEQAHKVEKVKCFAVHLDVNLFVGSLLTINCYDDVFDDEDPTHSSTLQTVAIYATPYTITYYTNFCEKSYVCMFFIVIKL